MLLFKVLIFSVFFCGQSSVLAQGIILKNKCPEGFYKKKKFCYPKSPYFNSKDTGLRKGIGASDYKLDPIKYDLGRYLFFDPILSKSKKISCATCHQPGHGFAEPRRFSKGHNEKLGDRNAPGLWNTALKRSWFWDQRAHSLPSQAEGPLFSEKEMANTRDNLEDDINNNEIYELLFKHAFDFKSSQKITTQHITYALTEFQKGLIALNSRYDDYAFGNSKALNQQELDGFNVFRSFLARCTECHTPPLFQNHESAVLGVPDYRKDKDRGRGKVLNHSDYNYSFAVPSLRNIAKTPPYMHNGAFASLENVIDFYSEGAGRGDKGMKVPRIHWHMSFLDLSDKEKNNVVEFLHSLTDRTEFKDVPSILPSGLENIR